MAKWGVGRRSYEVVRRLYMFYFQQFTGHSGGKGGMGYQGRRGCGHFVEVMGNFWNYRQYGGGGIDRDAEAVKLIVS